MMFFKDSDLADTSIGKIPRHWQVARIEEIALSKKGAIKIGPFGSQIKKSEMVHMGVKVYGQENVIENDFGTGNRYISQEKYETLKNFEIFPSDVLITMMGSIGYAKLFPERAKKGIMDSHLLRIQVKKELVMPTFLLQLVGSSVVRRQVRSLSRGAIMSGLNSETVRSIRIPLPPLDEQKEIVGVLDVVDLAVAKTGEVIAKTERLKKGLMQELLTKGIGQKEHKQTTIGTIPRKWQIARLEEVCKEVTIGVVNPATPYYTTAEEGVPYFRSQNVRENSLEPTNIYVKREFNEKHHRSILKENDVLTIQTGFIGTSCVVPKIYEGSNCHSLLIARTDPQALNSQFLCHLLNSEAGKSAIMRHNSGWGRAHLLLQDFRKIEIPLPPLREQQEIADIISTVYQKVKVEKTEKAKLERIKQGLMDLLLTGKVRVKVG